MACREQVQRLKIFTEKYLLTPDDVEIIIESLERATNFEQFVITHSDISPKLAANFFINKWYPSEDSGEITPELKPEYIAQFLKLIEDNMVTASIAYQRLWPELVKDPQAVLPLCQKLNLLQTSDQSEIENIARAVLEENPEQTIQYKKGKKGIITFFMGQVMRKSKGKANPELARETLERLLTGE